MESTAPGSTDVAPTFANEAAADVSTYAWNEQQRIGRRRSFKLDFGSASIGIGPKRSVVFRHDKHFPTASNGEEGANVVSEDAESSREPGLDAFLESSPVRGLKKSVSMRFEFEDNVSSRKLFTPAPIDDDDLSQQVKAAIPVDDESLSVSTPRMWTLALVSAIIGSSMNLLFSLRYPSVTLTPIVALLVVYPMGRLWDHLLKRSGDTDCDTIIAARGRCVGRLRLFLAQGRWNRKEHACVFVSSNVSFAFAFATDVIAEQVKFYKQDVGIVYQILLILSTQLLGYSLAGIFSDFLVRPKEMVWPSNLIATSMLSTLHDEKKGVVQNYRWMSRWQFFVLVFLVSFAWYFLPGLLFPALSYFNALTWLAPGSAVISHFFGVKSGLGLLPVTFDWSQIAYTGSPLIVPFWAAMNVLGGLVVVMWIIAPLLYYSNTFFSSYIPILDASVYDNKAMTYDIERILTSEYLFDEAAYHSYSEVYLPMTYALSYAMQFASMTALITHTACYHGKSIWQQMKSSLRRGRETFSTTDGGREPLQSPQMDEPLLGASTKSTDYTLQNSHSVPFAWYLALGLTTTAVGMFVMEYYAIHLPWWSIFVALAICLVLILPIGIVMAMTNLQISIYLIAQITAGVMFPGRGVANMIFVTYTYITSAQALKFSADLKLGQYMSIPPRILFKVQLVATIVSSLTQIAVLNWAFRYIPGICTSEAANGFSCPIARVHFNGSVLWGVIGPQRFFGEGALYRRLIWAFPIGAVMPLIVWLIGRRRGAASVWQKVNFPVIFGSLSWIPPASGLNFSVWALVCFVFNYIIKRRHEEWWKRYTMILSAGLDAGTAVSVLVIFFGVVYWGYADGLKWWGTEVFKQGCDWKGCAWRTLRDGETFGADTWR